MLRTVGPGLEVRRAERSPRARAARAHLREQAFRIVAEPRAPAVARAQQPRFLPPEPVDPSDRASASARSRRRASNARTASALLREAPGASRRDSRRAARRGSGDARARRPGSRRPGRTRGGSRYAARRLATRGDRASRAAPCPASISRRASRAATLRRLSTRHAPTVGEAEDPRAKRRVVNARLAELVDLLDLEEIDTDVYRGQNESDREHRLFGGQVAARRSRRPGRSVDGWFPHSLHGYFLRPGDPATAGALHRRSDPATGARSPRGGSSRSNAAARSSTHGDLLPPGRAGPRAPAADARRAGAGGDPDVVRARRPPAGASAGTRDAVGAPRALDRPAARAGAELPRRRPVRRSGADLVPRPTARSRRIRCCTSAWSRTRPTCR